LTDGNRWQYKTCNIPSESGTEPVSTKGRIENMAKKRSKSARKPAAKKAGKVAKPKRRARRKK